MDRTGEIAIYLIIRKLKEVIENIFFDKKSAIQKELISVDAKLKSEFDITILQIFENDLQAVTSKIKNIEISHLDKIIVLIYQNVNSDSQVLLIEQLKSKKNINERLFELIQFAESKSNKLSLERNNIKNSILHQLNNPNPHSKHSTTIEL